MPQYGGGRQRGPAVVCPRGRDEDGPHTEGDYATLPWEFTLLDSEVINAFALPGGKVFITRGLAEKLKTESELAGVLGHEIGHVTAEHADKRIANQMIFVGGLVVASAVAGRSSDDLVRVGVPLLVGAGGTGFILKFGRDEEFESDALGIRYMSRAGYDPMGQVRVMEVLAEASKGPRPPEFLSTHPYPEARVERARRLIEREYAHTQDNPAFGHFQQRYEQRMLAPMRALPQARHRVSSN